MKFIYFFFIIGFISCKAVPKVFDTWYNYEFDLKSQIEQDNFECDFRLPVNPGDKMDVEFIIAKNDSSSFSCRAFEYNYRPSDDDIISMEGGQEISIINDFSYEEGDYMVYSFSFSSSMAAAYFAIFVQLQTAQPYSYLVFRVNVARYKYSFIKDLNLNTNYIMDTSIFPDTRIPNSYQTYLSVPIVSQEEIEIILSTLTTYDKNNDFRVDVCGYVEKPTEKDVYYGNPGVPCINDLENISDEDKKYIFPFTFEENINYLSIRIINQLGDLTYLNIYINSTSSDNPSEEPSSDPSEDPSEEPSGDPSEDPSEDPSGDPSDGNDEEILDSHQFYFI